MANILEVHNLTKHYKDFTVNKVSFALEEGFIMGFIGPNGAGKSTTIKLMMNLLKRDQGEIKVFGLDNLQHEREIKQRIGFVYDENYYYEELTILDMKRVIAPCYRNWDDQVFDHYLRIFELPPKRKIKALSKGMKMKFALAVALSHHPDLIIMDEPTAGLDPIIRNELLEILAEFIQDERKAVFFSTHITTDLDKIADYITFINNGEIVFSVGKDWLLENYALVKGERELLDRDTRQCFVGIRENQYGFEALTANQMQVRQLFGDGVLIERPSLEEIMLFTIRREQHV